MSAFTQKVRRLGILVGVSAIVLAIAGLSASSAMAETNPTCPNNLTTNGKGSSLQKSAQEIWTAKYKIACPGPTVTYTSTGSGPGLEAFRFTGAGAINHSFEFIGTDDAPTEAQIIHAEEVAGGARPIIAPVTQTAISIPYNLPTGCKFKAGKGITWASLGEIFGGMVAKWRSVPNVEPTTVGGACDVAIKRVVRKEGSGTTFQFKNYLQALVAKGGPNLPCEVPLPGGGKATKWEQIETVGSAAEEEKPNVSWPCTVAEGGTEIITALGGGAVVEAVNANSGAIGYAALPDAKAAAHVAKAIALLQNGVTGTTPTWAGPATEESNAACSNARYTVPMGAYEGTEAGVAVNWSGVFGAQPNIGGEEYPLCTLTYDAGWTSYHEAGYGTTVAEGEAIAAAVEDYIGQYVVPPTHGQADLAGKWYATLPTGSGNSTNVQQAAEIAGMHFGFTCRNIGGAGTEFATHATCNAGLSGAGTWRRVLG